MAKIVTFSGGSVDLDELPIGQVPEGMTEERCRELLQSSDLGRSVLFYGTSSGAKKGWLSRLGGAISSVGEGIKKDVLEPVGQIAKGLVKEVALPLAKMPIEAARALPGVVSAVPGALKEAYDDTVGAYRRGKAYDAKQAREKMRSRKSFMSNVITFSGGSVDLDQSPIPQLEGIGKDRLRELLNGSALGRDVLFYGTSEGAKAGWLTRMGSAIKDTARTGYHVAKETLTGAAKGLGGGGLIGALATAPTGIGVVPGAVGGGLLGAIAGGTLGLQGGKDEIAARKSSESYHAGKLAEHASGLTKAIAEKDAAVNARDNGKLYGKSDTAVADKRIRDAHAKIKEHSDAIAWHKEGLASAKEFFNEESAVAKFSMHDDYEQAALMHKQAAKEAKTMAIASGEGPASEFERQAYKHEELARQYEYMAAHAVVAYEMGGCNE